MKYKENQAVDRMDEEDRGRVSFMDLAVEIRSRIYGYVYGSHSVQHFKLPLWYMTQGSGRHIPKPITSKATTKLTLLPCEGALDDNNASSHAPTRELLSAHRLMNHIPTALLLICCQVDSVQAARNFLNDRISADWQRQSMRYVRMQLDLSEDKSNQNSNADDNKNSNVKKAEAWEELGMFRR
ncbi:uncharacterized protein B0T23DRAFT_426176 [Neurospora hispaniola]|uniref:Uncharacterized protein n=1 Tax=Neurospora hispaniola TaxID=588809 RepID=A0AAJ0ICB5_9PEZI|nr:hypothetical protein B0T23DRAFT_426176 [Neurospora hispaniola]